jgi:hypothetical protein
MEAFKGLYEAFSRIGLGYPTQLSLRASSTALILVLLFLKSHEGQLFSGVSSPARDAVDCRNPSFVHAKELPQESDV